MITSKKYTIGRAGDIIIDHPTVSRVHLIMEIEEAAAGPEKTPRIYAYDNQSSNLTFIKRATGNQVFKEGFLETRDVLILGEYEVAVLDLLLSASTPQSRETDEQSPFSRYIRTEQGQFKEKKK